MTMANGQRDYFDLKGKKAEQVLYELAAKTLLTDWCYLNPRLPDGKELCEHSEHNTHSQSRRRPPRALAQRGYSPSHRAAILPESVGVIKWNRLVGGGPRTPVARRSIQADDSPGRRAGDIATGARRGAWAGRLGVEIPSTQVLGRPVRPAARDARGSGE